jgi:hypothetical protein
MKQAGVSPGSDGASLRQATARAGAGQAERLPSFKPTSLNPLTDLGDQLGRSYLRKMIEHSSQTVLC